MGIEGNGSEERSSSRRALLSAGIGAVAATVATALGRPLAAEATHGDVHLGVENVAASTTVITNTDTGESALWGNATATSGVNVGVRGDAPSAAGYGVWGLGGTGVRGETTLNYGIHGISHEGSDVGVYGEAHHEAGVAMRGWSVLGTGVHGTTAYGTAVSADAGSREALALAARGRVRFINVSGVATIPSGATSVVVKPSTAAVTTTSFVLLTPRVNLGGRDLWFTTDPATDRLTIRMSSSRSKPTPVAWLLIG